MNKSSGFDILLYFFYKIFYTRSLYYGQHYKRERLQLIFYPSGCPCLQSFPFQSDPIERKGIAHAHPRVRVFKIALVFVTSLFTFTDSIT